MKTATVIGAGFAGCTFAYFLRKAGWKVTVIEKAGITGGGVRTFFHGGHPFTYGPRHFLSPYKKAYDFLNEIVPLRDLKKINYSYNEKDQTFYTYPVHVDDIPRMPEAEQIKKELETRPPEGTENKNFEDFWINRVGATLYGKFIENYNKKAWLLDSNLKHDFGFQATVKAYPLESGDRHEFKEWYNCYPTAKDGYNRYFDVSLDGCEVRLNTTVSGFDLETRTVTLEGGEKLKSDILVSTCSPDLLMDYQYGELKYIGRDFYKIVLPIQEIFPKDVYFVYYPNANESQTRVVEYKKFTQHESPHTLIVLEVPSRNNRLYPTMESAEVEKAQKYIDALPEKIYSVGRMGTYRYVDIDDIILQAYDFVEKV